MDFLSIVIGALCVLVFYPIIDCLMGLFASLVEIAQLKLAVIKAQLTEKIAAIAEPEQSFAIGFQAPDEEEEYNE